MFTIIGMDEKDLISIDPQSVDWLLSKEEIVYMATVLGSFWRYDYEAAERGRAGMHAILKSELHSDGFFISRILLQHPNILTIMATQQALRFNQLGIPKPDWVAGIPDGATELGKEVARILGAKILEMKKENNRIVTVSDIDPSENLLLVEDFCTQGTGFKEAVRDILSKQPEVKILPVEMVIINRGRLKEIIVDGVGVFEIVPVAEHRVYDWESEECPLCRRGSISIKPKATDENWRLITTSQQ